MADPYLIEGSNVLANRLGFDDPEKLERAEAGLAIVRGLEVLRARRTVPVTMTAFRAVHNVVFRDSYEWAGTYRTVSLADEDGGDAGYSAVADIAEDGDRAMKAIAEALAKHYSGKRSLANILPGLADGYLALNAVHPFRDGNARAQKLFFSMLCRQSGFTIDWAMVPEHGHTRRALLAARLAPEAVRAHFVEMTYVGKEKKDRGARQAHVHAPSARPSLSPSPSAAPRPGPKF